MEIVGKSKSRVLVVKTLASSDAKRLMLFLEQVKEGKIKLGSSRVSPLDSRVLKIIYGEKK